jgi:VanZ family protein
VAALLGLAVALILYGTLYPFHFDFARTHANPFLVLLHSWPKPDRTAVRDAVLNIALFLPLGMTAFLAAVRRSGRAAGYAFALALGASLSALVEMLQVYDAHRYCSAADWLANTFGTFLGAALALTFQPRIEKLTAGAGRKGAPAALLLGACWLGAQLYPLIPLLRFAHLRGAWMAFVRTPISWLEVFAGAAAWFAFAFLLRTVWTRFATGWLALAMLAIPLRLLIADRAMTATDLLAAAAGLSLGVVTPDAARQGAAWVLLLTAIVAQELAPFHFGPFHPFSWTLLGATMASAYTPAVTVLLRKVFEYGTVVWLLRASKIGYLAAGTAVAAALAAMEALQCFLPGRHPEITDPILALLMALVLRLVS